MRVFFPFCLVFLKDVFLNCNDNVLRQMQKGATNQMMAEFDTLTEIISDKTDPNRLGNLPSLSVINMI